MAFRIPIIINNPSYFNIIPNIIIKHLNLNFGCIPHDDEKTGIKKADVDFSQSSLIKTASIVGDIDLKRYFRPISNQYNLGSCVANGVADTAEAMFAKQFNINPSSVPDFSRLFIYYNARNNTTPPTADKDNGTYISIAMDSISRYGITNESIWPYDTSKVFTRPSVLAYRTALQNRFFNYYSINSSGDQRIADIVKALSNGCPVVFGTKVDAAFTVSSGAALVGPPSKNFVGGHCMVVVGKSGNNFVIRNSWGTEWRNSGYVMFTPEYLKADITHDIWVLVRK